MTTDNIISFKLQSLGNDDCFTTKFLCQNCKKHITCSHTLKDCNVINTLSQIPGDTCIYQSNNNTLEFSKNIEPSEFNKNVQKIRQTIKSHKQKTEFQKFNISIVTFPGLDHAYDENFVCAGCDLKYKDDCDIRNCKLFSDIRRTFGGFVRNYGNTTGYRKISVYVPVKSLLEQKISLLSIINLYKVKEK